MNATEDHCPASSAALDDPRVVAALREYLDALEAGDRPDRAAFVACHPSIADALSECLEGLDFVHSAAGTRFVRSRSILTGSVSVLRPRRRLRRLTWVSTGNPGTPKALPRMTLAVLRPTPFSATNSSMVVGTSPPWRSTSCRQQSRMLRALAR